MQKKKKSSNPCLTYKNQLKCVINLNVKPKAIKLLGKKKKGENLQGGGQGREFLDLTPKV